MGSLLHNLPIFQIFQKLRIDRSKKWKMNEENNLFLNFFKENEEKGRFRAKRRRFIRKFRDKRNQRNLDKSNQRRQLLSIEKNIGCFRLASIFIVIKH